MNAREVELLIAGVCPDGRPLGAVLSFSFALAQSANHRLALICGHVLDVFARRTANDAIEIPRRQTAHITFNAYAQSFCFETYLIASPSHFVSLPSAGSPRRFRSR